MGQKITKADMKAFNKRKSKTEVAAIETESNEAVALMATETLDAADIAMLDEAIESATIDVVDDVITDIAVIDQVVQVLEATEIAVQDVPATEQMQGEPSEITANAWDDAITAINQDEAIAMTLKVAAAIDERKDFEAVKDAGNANIQRTLKKAAAQLSLPSAVKAMMVTDFSIGQLNRSVHSGSRYNVYALGKLADVLNGVVNGAINNAINNACLRSLLKFDKAGVPFNMDMAKAACSDKIRIQDKNQLGCLVRHTVSASTAPTQASSTMQALTDLGIVSRSGSERNPIFALTDAPIVAKLTSVLQG